MEALLLAGGKGERLGEAAEGRPLPSRLGVPLRSPGQDAPLPITFVSVRARPQSECFWRPTVATTSGPVSRATSR